MGIAFDGEDGGSGDGSRFCDASDIVAAEVDEHDMFGDFFGVREKVLFEGKVFFGGFAAFACASEWAVGDFAFVDAAEDFGGRANEDAAVDLEIKHVWGGIDDSKRAIDVEGVGFGFDFKALRGDDLEGVTGFDVFFDFVDDFLVAALPHCGGW